MLNQYDQPKNTGVSLLRSSGVSLPRRGGVYFMRASGVTFSGISIHMAIDEKHIDGQFYTVLSNAKTGKVALLCSTIKSNEIKICLDKFGKLLETVSYVTLNLSQLLNWLSMKILLMQYK